MCISSSSLHIFCALMLSVGNSGSYRSGPRQAYFFFSAASIAVVCFFFGSRLLHRTSSSRLLHRLRRPPLPPSPPLHISLFSLLNDAVPSIRGSFRGMTESSYLETKWIRLHDAIRSTKDRFLEQGITYVTTCRPT